MFIRFLKPERGISLSDRRETNCFAPSERSTREASTRSRDRREGIGNTPEIASASEEDGGEFSRREEDVLRLVAQGFSNKRIAGQLEVSVKSVETYKARAIEKQFLRSRADIVRCGIKQGWLRRQTEHGGDYAPRHRLPSAAPGRR